MSFLEFAMALEDAEGERLEEIAERARQYTVELGERGPFSVSPNSMPIAEWIPPLVLPTRIHHFVLKQLYSKLKV